jgi:hypothetical protein
VDQFRLKPEAEGGPIPVKSKAKGGLYTIGVGILLFKRLGQFVFQNALALHFSKCPTTYKENIPWAY